MVDLYLCDNLGALPVPGEAAKPPRPPVPGDRVRVSILDAPPVTGTLLAHRIDALELALAPDSTRRTIARIQVVGAGALVGSGILGLALGALVGGAIEQERWEPAPLP